MSQDKKGKHKLSHDSHSLSYNPFDALSAEGLPKGPDIIEPASLPLKPSKKGEVFLRKETAGRNGKPVIIVERFETQVTSLEIEELAKSLRKKLGCGGTVQERLIELQCHDLARIRELLEKEGFRPRGEK